ncbi:MAG TPA: glycosyltransferase family 4 protein [Pirellulales bacterium]|nr:glycosyltransferase family 4 protein [Pirellulales bacterium]
MPSDARSIAESFAAPAFLSAEERRRLKAIRVGFISGRFCFSGDGIWADAGLGRLLDALYPWCGRLTAALCQSDQPQPLLDHRLQLSPDDVLRLPDLPSIGRGFGKIASCRRVIRAVEERSDVVIVQLPFAATLALAGARRPRVYQVCADIWAFARRSSRFAGWKRPPALIAGGLIDRLQAGLFRRGDVRVVTNGTKLRMHYGQPPGRAVISSTILEPEIGSASRSRPADAPWRVLYVGYVRHEKGTDLLVDAFSRVLDAMPHAELEVVAGRDEAGRGMAAGFEKSLTALEKKGTVRFLGHRNFGPDLFQCFADADVLVVPSRTEGTPRVLVEARAFGCPVIGTSVGGIPTSITDGVDGLLVPPEDAPALAEAILRLARDQPLRERLIAAGYETARRSTVEVFAAGIAEEVAALAALDVSPRPSPLAPRP